MSGRAAEKGLPCAGWDSCPNPEHSHRDALAREVADLLAEWRKTCNLMGMRWTDRAAGAFVADAIGHRVTSSSVPEAVRDE